MFFVYVSLGNKNLQNRVKKSEKKGENVKLERAKPRREAIFQAKTLWITALMSLPCPYQLPTNSHPTPTMVGDGRVEMGPWNRWKCQMVRVGVVADGAQY